MRIFPILGLVLAAGAFLAFQEAESVDFSKPPKQGLKIKATKSFEIKMAGTLGEGEAVQTIDVTLQHKEIFNQTFTSVEDGSLRSIEREYEESVSNHKMDSDIAPEPQEQERESPLAWKHFRASWDGDEFSLRVKDDDTWSAAEDKTKALLTKHELRSPLLPLPGETKTVGDSWKVELRPFIASLFGGMQRNMPEDIEGEVTVKLAAIKRLEEHRDAKCAVLEVKLEMSREAEGSKMQWQGVFHYSLEHRIILAQKGKGTMERDAGGQELEGTAKSSAKVEIVPDAR